MASEIKTMLESYKLVCRSLVFVATPPSGRRTAKPRLARAPGISPLRGSLRAALIACTPRRKPRGSCDWTGVPLWANEVVAKQPAKAAFGWAGYALHLIWPSFYGIRWCSAGGLGAPSASLAHSLMLSSCRIFGCQATQAAFSGHSLSIADFWKIWKHWISNFPKFFSYA